MKKNNINIQKLLLIALICSIISSDDVFSQTAFKGIELNSWKSADGDWHFSLLIGTNRKKLIQEIKDPKVTIVGVANLKKKLAELPKGENVFWVNHAKEPVPEKAIKDLSEYSKSIGIILYINTI
ncbi:MAG: hypothetical protein C0403_08005 [Desulfobacterium sp.]|nr:hypothetical protein [Desulfobacterium sp.]